MDNGLLFFCSLFHSFRYFISFSVSLFFSFFFFFLFLFFFFHFLKFSSIPLLIRNRSARKSLNTGTSCSKKSQCLNAIGGFYCCLSGFENLDPGKKKQNLCFSVFLVVFFVLFFCVVLFPFSILLLSFWIWKSRPVKKTNTFTFCFLLAFFCSFFSFDFSSFIVFFLLFFIFPFSKKKQCCLFVF